MAIQSWLVGIAWALLWWSAGLVQGQAPSPVTCENATSSCTIGAAFYPWFDRRDCKVARVYYPSTEEELVAVVAEAARLRKSVRVVSKGAHSSPKLICPRGDDGLLISMSRYNRTIVVDPKARTATLDAGVTLTPFVETAARFGLAFPHSTYWAGLSIAGVLATGAHGSSLWGKGSALFEYVVGMRIVVAVPGPQGYGYAKVVELRQGDKDLKAAKVSLGLLGVVSTVTLRLQPQFKRSITFVQKSDADLARQLIANARRFEFGGTTWFPHMQMALFREDKRVPISTPGEGAYHDPAFVPIPISTIVQSRQTEEFLELTRNASAKCLAGAAQFQQMQALGFGFNNNGTAFSGFPVVGFQNAMQVSGGPTCDQAPFLNGTGFACTWDRRIENGIRFFDTAYILPLAKLAPFVRDVKALLALDPSSLCGLGFYNGLLMRYVKKSTDAYLGYTADSVALEIVHFRSSDARVPTLNGATYSEIQQLLLFKYGARPHLGKNTPTGYIGSHRHFPDLRKFLLAARRFDPLGLFSTDWTDQVLNVGGANKRVEVKRPFCALEGLCLCDSDEHCNPAAGSFCRPGLVLPEARVCRFEAPL